MSAEARIWGATAAEVRHRVGSFAQVARAEELVHSQGAARGTRVIRVETGGGLSFDVLPDRALDIGSATYRGMPLAWISPTGFTAPAFASQRGTDWLRSFGGGLLTTCGLDAFGPPSEDESGEHPMHGRVSSTPATLTQVGVSDEDITIVGEVRQVSVFGENLVLRRRITARVGSADLKIDDVVTNEDHSAAGHMILYHCNLGWPLISEHSHLDIPSNGLVPRDAAAEAGVASWHALHAPQPGYAEQVFRHDFEHVDDAVVSVDNPGLDVRLQVRFDSATLPGLHQWKMLGEGHYVLGIEPTNVNWSLGRAAAAREGVLPMLEPGQSVRYSMEFSAGSSNPAKAKRGKRS